MTNLEKKVFLGKGICLSEEESTKAQLKIRNGIGLVRNMQMNLRKKSMKNMNHIELSVELMSILRALNYSCELKTIEGKSIVMDIAVQGELSVRHQKMIEMLLGGFLSEFYWVNGKHHIYIREECKGLLPDDDRYSCLIYEMNKVSSDEERINSYGKEYFFNLGDRFERKLKIGL